MDDIPSPATGSGRSTHVIPWLLLLLLAGTGLTILFAHAPPRIRLLGLFAIAFGLIVGIVSRKLAEFVGLRRRGLILMATFCVVVLGQIGIAVETYGIEAKQRHANSENDQAQSAVATAMLRRAKPPEDEKSRELHEQIKAALLERDSFSAFLAKRVSGLGSWTSPWPELFWGLEVLVAASFGTILGGRRPVAETRANPL